MSLLDGKRWVFWLDLTHPDPNNKPGEPKCYRVSVVIENEPGHLPTGGTGTDCKAPWYWDKETCKKQNEERGFSEEEVWRIVASSMSAGKV